ncbi:cell-division associated ABC transporter, membrane FtsX subunit [Ligilactobacillus ceti DSM 22408]|uniref:Cell division protein FtsX n=2 Tax=Ligilactobacillus TaxID=2767887 RepID=A0A0R2KVB1_9LACO|nr:cell-division associated ABC transporter, membrane FtsX subunit [Ligilactobacillus ceti DSM 22408]
MSVAAVGAVTVTLLLVGFLLSVLMNVNKVASDIENNVQVRVIIDRGTKEKGIKQIKKSLEKIDGVESIKFSSRKQELHNVVGVYGSEFKLISGDQNPLYDVYVVDAKNPDKTIEVAKKAKKIKNVYDAKYGGTSAKKLFKLASSIQHWGIFISVLLLFVAVFLIENTIKITIMSRQNEIEIMRLVGATNSYIRWPFILEGAWTGLLGTIIPIFLTDFGYNIVYRVMSNSLKGSGYQLVAPHVLLFQIDLLLIVIGIGIGALGAGVSMRRFLKI